MKIKKRDNRLEQLSFDKIIYRLRKLCNDKNLGILSSIDPDIIAQRVVSSIYDGVTSCELDEEAARIAVSMIENLEYQKLASRIVISNLHKSTNECFSEVMENLYNNFDKNGNSMPIIADDIIEIIRKHKNTLNFAIDYNRDYLFDYFGFKTLERSYLMKIFNKEQNKMVVVERPQHMYMRVALGIHKDDIESALSTYNLISQHYYTHASPTIFNAGGRLANLSSCFLIGSFDSIEGIFKTMTDCAKISKLGGGIGTHITNIRAKGSLIRGTNGVSDGIIPMLKVYNEIGLYVNQCILPDINVFSKDGIKTMSEVSTNDYLITHDGTFKKVNQIIINNKKEEVFKIYNTGSIEPLKCTGIHDIYVIEDNSSHEYKQLISQLEKGVTKPFYIEANKLNINHIMGYPIPTYEKDIQEWTPELCRSYGNEYFINDKDKLKDILHLPKHKISNVLKGILESNQSKTSIESTDYTDIMFVHTSKELVQNMKYMFLRLGVLVTVMVIIGEKGERYYNMKIPRLQILKDLDIFHNFKSNNCILNYFTWNNIIWSRIIKIEKEFYTGKVYDFNMIDNHNYLTESGLVHNSGKRKGSFAMYIEPWHADIMEFLELRKNQGHENLRARDLFYAMWTPDLFMKQVENDGDWYLMCPDECPGLTEVYGDDFEKLYWKYVEEKRYKRIVKAQDIWTKIMDSQIETGVPYIAYKDNVNKKCNQKNLGTIKSSNLCCEISLYSDDKEYGVCNLASVALPKFVECDNHDKPYFNFEKLREIAKYIVGPMNKVIDHNHYPVPETHKSNMAHRPIGIGIQGLSDVYIKMKLPFESEGAKKLNKEIFETLYYGCLQGTIEEAKRDGSYSTYEGSPFSQGKLQFDLCKEFDNINLDEYLSGRWDWDALKRDLKQYGARNSMLIALMPTASTAQIMNNSECFEPIDSCIFKRRVLSGEYIVINKYLVSDLEKLGLWSKEMKDRIITLDGSIQQIPEIPDEIKAIYKTVWELSMKSVIEQSRDRGVFVDQMQSMNLFMANPNYKKLTSMHFYAWKQHLKTGMYYLRSRGQSSGKFSVDVNIEKQIREKQEKGEALTKQEEEAVLACSLENPEACMLCSS
jgi:ribonucleoside-diphosphate reductase alpha subunit